MYMYIDVEVDSSAQPTCRPAGRSVAICTKSFLPSHPNMPIAIGRPDS